LFLHLGWSAHFAFFSPHSFNVELFTFLKPCVSHLLEALCYSSSGALLSSRDRVSEKWGEGRRGDIGRRGAEVGRRGKFWGREGGSKIPGQGKRMCFWFIHKTAWRASSWTGALVAAGSLQPPIFTLSWGPCHSLSPLSVLCAK
jgi:hypothetical protein